MAYHIFGNATLEHICNRVPRTKEELLEISGIGKAKVSKYGDRVLETIETTLSEYYNYDINKHNSVNGDSDGEIINSPKGRKEAVESCSSGSSEHEDGVNFKELDSTNSLEIVHYLDDDDDDDNDYT